MSPRPTEPSGAPRPGDIVAGKYRVERSLGHGGMGVVVAARHLVLGEDVALKFLLPTVPADAKVVERFLREARVSSRIKSEHTARVHDVGTLENGKPFMVMELLEGMDLGRLIRERGPLPAEEAVDYVLQACDAVSMAHALGIIHRDLKPSNLFLTHRQDGSALVKVLDFGIAKLVTEADANLTTTADMLGSPLYMSPEQIREPRSADPRIDVWALGVILFKLLSASEPYGGDGPLAVLATVMSDPPTPLRELCPHVPPALEAIVIRCLEKNPERRWPSIDALARALHAFALGLPAEEGTIASVVGTTARYPSDAVRLPQARWGRARIAAMIAFTGLGAALALGLLRRAPTPAPLTPKPAEATPMRAEDSPPLPTAASTSSPNLAPLVVASTLPSSRMNTPAAPLGSTPPPIAPVAPSTRPPAKTPKPQADVDKDSKDAIDDRY
jgi:eukaryotic-like serine/threonine-protein kinase